MATLTVYDSFSGFTVTLTYSVTNTSSTNTAVKLESLSTYSSSESVSSTVELSVGGSLVSTKSVAFTKSKTNTYSVNSTTNYTRGTSAQTKQIKLFCYDAGQNTVNVTIPVKEYTATYYPNGGSGSNQAQTYSHGSSMTTKAANTFSRTNYVFKNWNTNADGTGTTYNASTAYTPNANLSLYAQWYAPHTITYKANDGTSEEQTQVKVYNTAATVKGADAFSRDGWLLTGWNTASDGTGDSVALGASYSTEADITLYAQWQRGISSVTIGNATVIRTENSSSTSESDAGAYAYVQVPLTVSGAAAASISLSVELYDDSGTLIVTVSGTTSTKSTGDASVTPTLTARLSGLGTDSRYDAKCIVSVSNTSYSSQSVAPVSKTLVIPIAMYTIAAKPGGHGVAFGAPSTEDGAKFGFPIIGEVKRGSTALFSRTCYPCFVYSAFPTDNNSQKDESQLPITPCFVLDTSDNAFYYCDGS